MEEYKSNDPELLRLADKIKKLIRKRQLPEAETEIKRLMSLFPDCALPHNLYGILCEAKNQHTRAMNHFRAALALEPTDKASAYNLELFGRDSQEKRRPAYSEKDLGFFQRLAQKLSPWDQAV